MRVKSLALEPSIATPASTRTQTSHDDPEPSVLDIRLPRLLILTGRLKTRDFSV